jgi:glycosyltransferase involved in cell wall biosynthesis
VVAARAGALPEVLGDAAMLADPTSVDDLATAIAAALDDDALRARLVAAGARCVVQYSWAATADALVECYRRLALTP